MRRNQLRGFIITLALLLATVAGAQPARASETAFDPVPGGTPGSLLSPANGQMWVGVSTPDGLRIDRYRNGSMTSTTYPGVPSGALSGTATNDVWLNSGTSLWHFNGSVWDQVTLPTGPGGETMSPTAMDDVAGPDFYVMFTYFAVDGNTSYATTLGHFDGTSWTLLGQPSGDIGFESVMALKVTDTGIVALASTYRGTDEYVLSYIEGAWKTPVRVGNYFCCSVNKWVYDWVVDSATSIWLYGDNSDDHGSLALCAHFDGSGIDDSPCITGRNRYVMHAEKLPDGRHMVANDVIDLLDQPDQASPVAATGVTNVRSLAVEKGTGVVYAVATRGGVSTLMRYGVSTDVDEFVVTARLARSTLEKGDAATIMGTIEPVPAKSSDRTVVLEVKRNGLWKKAASMRATTAGAYRFSIEQPTVGIFEYRVRKPATGTTAQKISQTLEVTVLQPFKVTASAPGTVKRNRNLVVTGKVTPASAAAGSTVLLQIKSGGLWRTLVDATATSTGRYRLEVILRSLGTRTLRVYKEASGARSARVSKTLSVRVVK